MRLSPNFTLAELTRSFEGARRGLENKPTAYLIDRLQALCVNVLEPTRAHFGGRPVSVWSGFRSVAVNKLVGGSSTSRHLTAEAVDFEIMGVSNLDVCRWIATSKLPFDEVILERYKPGDPNSGWVHVAHRMTPGRNAREVWRIAMAGEKAVWGLDGID